MIDYSSISREVFQNALKNNDSYMLAGVVTDVYMALDAILEFKPDIIVVGIIQYKMNGLLLVNRIRESYLSGMIKEMPLTLMVSRIGSNEWFKKMKAIGLYHHLAIPAPEEVVVRMLENLEKEAAELNSKIITMINVTERDVREYLVRKGLKPHLTGFYMLTDAIMMALQSKSLSWGVMNNEIYPSLSVKYGKKAHSIEKDISFALKNRRPVYCVSHYDSVSEGESDYGSISAMKFIQNAVCEITDSIDDREEITV